MFWVRVEFDNLWVWGLELIISEKRSGFQRRNVLINIDNCKPEGVRKRDFDNSIGLKTSRRNC